MTRAERLAKAELTARLSLEKHRKHLAQVQAAQRATERETLARRRVRVGHLVEQAGLLQWDDSTLQHLFAGLAALLDCTNPVAVLSSLLENKAPRKEAVCHPGAL